MTNEKRRARRIIPRRVPAIRKMLRKSSPYFEAHQTDSALVTKLTEVAEVLSSLDEEKKIKFKLNMKKAAQLSLNELVALFSHIGYELSPGLQKSILKLQGISRFAELLLRKSDLILKPTGFLELNGIQALLTYNAKERIFHAHPMDFFTIRQFLENKGYPIILHLYPEFTLSSSLKQNLHFDLVLREYQDEALRRWFGAKKRGVVVLPSGAGKTVVALAAMCRLALKTLIVVPTIDLLNQWREAIELHLNLADIGMLGGGSKNLAPITIATYDSASLMASKLVTSFGFLIFDEVHHLPSPRYRLAAEISIAPFRLGLTATPERYDELHHDLDRLVGPTVYRISPQMLERNGYLAPYRIQTIQVALTDEEQAEYEGHMTVFRQFTQKLSNLVPGWRFDTIIERTLFDPEARKALSHLEKARRIALEASGKIEYVENLLHKYREAKIIIFSRYTRIVEKLSDLFGIPLITHKTRISEREHILTGFKKGVFSKIVTGQVLDEGVDVPDASVGIIISGTGSKREFIQRLGRLLRPEKEEAILIELVTAATLENGLARRRRFGTVEN